MKKKITALSIAALTVGAMLCATACGGDSTIALKGAALPHYDGIEETQGENSYDSRLFYRNDLTLFGGDSDVLYVSEDEARTTATANADRKGLEGTEKEEYINDYVAEYGGWFYQYNSGNSGVAVKWWSDRDYTGVIACVRSRDLNDWELCGAHNGFSVELVNPGTATDGQWIMDNVWAPELTYDPETKLYYMFLSASSFYQEAGLPKNPFGFGVLQSETPVGPFELCTTEGTYGTDVANHPAEYKYENGRRVEGETVTRNITKSNFQIDIGRYFDLPYVYPVIDISPFEDEDGKKYLYFSKEYINTGNSNFADSKAYERNEDGTLKTDAEGNYIVSKDIYSYGVLSIWAMEMSDWLTPKYETLRMVAYPGYKSVEYKGGPVFDDASYDLIPYANTAEEPYEDDGTLVEGAQMLVHTDANGQKKYYLTYSQYGYMARDYGVHQAVSDSPFGPFVKLGRSKSMIHTSMENDYMTGGGHHTFIEVGGELFCVYWVHCDTPNLEQGDGGRIYALDRVFYTRDEKLGMDILFGNGPTNSLQAKPYIVSGYKNVADQATITVSTENKAGVKWLNDGTFTTLEAFSDREFFFSGNAQITLTFKKPVTIGAIQIYNSMNYETAFAKVDGIVFKLAEKPVWYQLPEYNSYLYIKDLGFHENYYNAAERFMRQGGSSVASFNDISVTEITVGISKNLSATGTRIGVSEIVVLGK